MVPPPPLLARGTGVQAVRKAPSDVFSIKPALGDRPPADARKRSLKHSLLVIDVPSRRSKELAQFLCGSLRGAFKLWDCILQVYYYLVPAKCMNIESLPIVLHYIIHFTIFVYVS